ncbi:hypothetical protein HDU97_004767 [Phlyctochytrium planicorne]|nr:hypothetical protein HDU97_004767 [Phlyctochytrium planicorne]
MTVSSNETAVDKDDLSFILDLYGNEEAEAKDDDDDEARSHSTVFETESKILEGDDSNWEEVEMKLETRSEVEASAKRAGKRLKQKRPPPIVTGRSIHHSVKLQQHHHAKVVAPVANEKNTVEKHAASRGKDVHLVTPTTAVLESPLPQPHPHPTPTSLHAFEDPRAPQQHNFGSPLSLQNISPPESMREVLTPSTGSSRGLPRDLNWWKQESMHRDKLAGNIAATLCQNQMSNWREEGRTGCWKNEQKTKASLGEEVIPPESWREEVNTPASWRGEDLLGSSSCIGRWMNSDSRATRWRDSEAEDDNLPNASTDVPIPTSSLHGFHRIGSQTHQPALPVDIMSYGRVGLSNESPPQHPKAVTGKFASMDSTRERTTSWQPDEHDVKGMDSGVNGSGGGGGGGGRYPRPTFAHGSPYRGSVMVMGSHHQQQAHGQNQPESRLNQRPDSPWPTSHGQSRSNFSMPPPLPPKEDPDAITPATPKTSFTFTHPQRRPNSYTPLTLSGAESPTISHQYPASLLKYFSTVQSPPPTPIEAIDVAVKAANAEKGIVENIQEDVERIPQHDAMALGMQKNLKGFKPVTASQEEPLRLPRVATRRPSVGSFESSGSEGRNQLRSNRAMSMQFWKDEDDTKAEEDEKSRNAKSRGIGFIAWKLGKKDKK